MANRARSERGAVAVLAAVMTLVLFGVMAFVTDFGLAYAKQRALQNAADSAALSAARQIAAGASRTDTCSSLETAYPDSTVKGLAEPIFGTNDPTGQLAESTVDCLMIPGYTKPQLVVTVKGHEQTPTFFGRAMGSNSLEVNSSARVIMGNALPYGLRPFGLCQVDAQRLANIPGAHTVVFPNTSDASHTANFGCGSASGNAGLLDLDAGGGGRGAGPTGCDGTQGWIECGFNGTVPDPSSIPGQSGGFGGGLDSAMDTLKDKDIPLPVYTTVTGHGSATYAISGFVVVTVCGWDFDQKPSAAAGGSTHPYGCYDGPEWTGAANAAGTTWGDQKIQFLQLKYVKSITVGELDGNCALGDASCDYGARAVWLAD